MRLRCLLAFLLALDVAASAWAQTAVLSYPPPVRPLGYCQLSVGASAVALTTCTGGIPAGTVLVNLTVSTANLRYRDDGTNPTATVGIPILQGQNVPYSGNNPAALVFIAQSGTAAIDIGFYGR
jgi:hypothetical protein